MNPKKHKEFKEKIAEEVGVHQSVVDDFIAFYYAKLRKHLSNLQYPRIQVDGLGTFILRKSKLDKAIKRNKSMLGNIAKRTYNGFAKSEDIQLNIDNMEKAREQIEKSIIDKKNFKNNKNGSI
jgi:nucleoid DNA-binding protein|tara:strand:- start:2742 stop:3110 length:369 start_codon:yes stop_codon:yes gene_type:complete